MYNESARKAQKKYDKKRKKIAASVSNEKYNIIVEHMKKQGFDAVNAYLLHLVDEDIKNAVLDGVNNNTDNTFNEESQPEE